MGPKKRINGPRFVSGQNNVGHDVVMEKQTLVHGKKEGNVLFNDALYTFYIRLYGVRHVVHGHILYSYECKGCLFASFFRVCVCVCVA